MARKRWRKPILHNHIDENHDHKATWLELFFDLVFVASVAELTHKLAGNISMQGFLEFTFLFIPIWWVWIGITFYTDRFETNDISQRLFTFLSMLGVASLAYHVHDGLGATSVGFALSYVFVRSIIIVMWARAGIHNPHIRPVVNAYLLGFTLSISLWIASLWVDMPWRFAMWGLGLAIEYATPLLTLSMQERLGSLNQSKHLPERFGLFMIIVLGESLIGVVKGISEAPHLTLNSLFTAILGATFAFTIWWLYFDFINPRPIRKGTNFVAIWAYAHLPLVMSIAALGAGVLTLIQLNGDILPPNIIWLVCGSLAIAFMSFGVLELTLTTYKNRLCSTAGGKSVRYGGAIICLILPFIPFFTIAWRLLGVLTLIVVAQILHSEASDCHKHTENVLNDTVV